MKIYNIILTLTFALFLTQCALYEPRYRNPEEAIRPENFQEIDPNTIDRTFYLIGDAGYASEGQSTPGLKAFENYLGQQTHSQNNNFAIFLGDNIYPDGMPPKDATDRGIAEHRLDVQIEAIDGFDGEVIFIPGNHDWYNEGLKGLRREENYFEDKLKDKKVFIPSKGCAFQSMNVGDNIQLMVLDSQWYLEDWDKHPTMNDDCPEIKTRRLLFLEIESEFKKNQDKTILFVLHHPLYTNGVHGGAYAPVKHLYPSQKKIPLPGLGSLAMLIRTSGGISIQDKQNEQYKKLVNRLTTLGQDVDRLVFASGHEHSLQYIENEGTRQIVSGSGSKASFARLRDDAFFVEGAQGFARLDVLKDGSSVVTFFDSKENKANPVYRKEIIAKPKEPVLDTLPDQFPTTQMASIYPPKEKEDKLYTSIWGDHYRELYHTPINVKVALLDTLYGGLRVERAGGGHQTKSLRLVGATGKEYNLRALKKNSIQFLQAVAFQENYISDALENSIADRIIEDFYTAAHPYAFLAIPKLSDAAGVFHTNPQILYVPKQKALGKYNLDYGDELYMIEERPEENHKDSPSFGQPDDIESTADVYERIRKDEKYKVDEPAYIRARLFDMLIGDWDRHDDQWRWAEYEQENGDHIFKPIPRDRDQAFSNFDGALLGSLKSTMNVAKQFQVYDEELESVRWMNVAALKLDRTLIQNSQKDIWLQEAKALQAAITPQVVEDAFGELPREMPEEDSKELQKLLLGRLENLDDIASRYYKYLSRLAIVTGTDKDDYITVTRMPKGKTQITINRIKDGKKADEVSQKTYDRNYTKEIWLYGLDDDDVFEVEGEVDNPIDLRIIGGQNNDVYRIKKGRAVTIYDHKSKKNTVERKGSARLRFTDDYQVNSFDKDKRITKTNAILPAIGWNPDDGFRIGLQDVYTVNGFHRNPFTRRHTFTAGYFFATQGFSIDYKGEFAGVLGSSFNLLVRGNVTGPNFTENFFGFGNDTENLQDELDRDFNRVKISTMGAGIGAVRNGRFGSYFEFNLNAQGYQVDNTEGRFISRPILELQDDIEVGPDFYDRKWFGGVEATYRYESYDVAVNPTQGMKFELKGGSQINLEETDRIFGYLYPYLGFYNALTRNRKFVLRTVAQSQHIFGDDFEFYQGAQIGRLTGLRGYRIQRFTGQHSLTGSADIRYSFNQFKTRFLPLQIGIFAGADTGRVWLNGEDSNTWHSDFGGGFWINSLDAVSGTFNLFAGDDGLQFSFGFGFKF